MQQAANVDLGRVAQDLQLKRKQIEAVVQLLDEENTVPFITRYRREQTGNLDEEQIRAIQRRVTQLRQLAERRQTILRTIEAQGKLTPELQEAIESAPTAKRLEDLYLPYKPKKQTLATIARQRGLGPLAEAIWTRDEIALDLPAVLEGLVDPDKQLATADDVLTGVKHILAERISEDVQVRDAVRAALWSGKLVVSKANADTPAEPGGEGAKPFAASEAARKLDAVENEFRNYFQYSEPLRNVPPHRTLAINRGEKLGVLKVRFEYDHPRMVEAVLARLPLEGHPHRALLESCAQDALDRLILRAIEREIRSELTDEAELHAVQVFARNLRNLLLQAPVRGRRVLAIDPGYRAGCKYAALDEIGNLLEQGIVHPHPVKKKKKPRGKLALAGPATAAAPSSFAEGVTESAEGTESSAPGNDSPAAARDESTPAHESGSATAPETGHESPPVLPADAVYRETPEGDRGDRTLPETSSVAVGRTAASETLVETPRESAPTDAAPPGTAPTSSLAVGGDGRATPTMHEAVEAAPIVAQPDVHAEQEVAALWAELKPGEKGTKASRRRRRKSPVSAGIVLPTPDDVEERRARAAEREHAKSVKPDKPAPPPSLPTVSKRERAKRTLADVCTRHQISVIAIGNGSGCRETEELVSEMIGHELPDAEYVIVNEAGASVYSTNAVGREEFPHFDATLRGTISIGRRLQDPLSELVKIEPQHIGVGLYQHDINPRLLRDSLNEVVESCVNYVGVELNTASVPLLQYVSGLNQLRARNLVEHRKTHGPFRNREQLRDVAGIGPAVFTQAAGFLKISGGDQPFDATWIHPESYPTAEKILQYLGCDASVLANRNEFDQLRARLSSLDVAEVARQVEASEALVQDILANLARPGRDPREDLPTPVFRKGILKLEDLTDGMQLRGTVLNVVDFGVFVDIGLKDSGLVHISQLANRYVRSPHDVVAVGDVVTTWVLHVDRDRRRVSLTMIEPGTERPPEERRPPRRGRPEKRPARTPETATQTAATAAGAPAGASGQATGGDQRRDRRSGNRDRFQGQRRGARQPRERMNTRGQARPTHLTRKPKDKPPVILSQEALEGKEVLHTFGELKALFEAKKKSKGGGDESKSKT